MLKRYEKYLDRFGMLIAGMAFIATGWFLASAQQIRHTSIGHSLFGYERPATVSSKSEQYISSIDSIPLALQPAPLESKDGVCGCPTCCRA